MTLVETVAVSHAAKKTHLTGKVFLTGGSLAEKNGDIVAVGFFGVEALRGLRVGPYQREVLAPANNRKGTLAKAISEGVQLPAILIGMRGQSFTTTKGGIILNDPCYIIDGLQRTSAILRYAESNPEAQDVFISAEIRFGTTEEFERKLFINANTKRVPVGPNIVLRNLCVDHHSLLTLYGLSNSDKNFALYKRICWDQRMRRGEVLSALILTRSASALHGRSYGEQAATKVGAQLDQIINSSFGLSVFRKNVSAFFALVDECWGLREIQTKQTSAHTKGNFLTILAKVFAEHHDFWNENGELVVSSAWRSRLRSFPVTDPEVMRLAAAGTMAQPILQQMLIDHLNKGKRQHRLKQKNKG